MNDHQKTDDRMTNHIYLHSLGWKCSRLIGSLGLWMATIAALPPTAMAQSNSPATAISTTALAEGEVAELSDAKFLSSRETLVVDRRGNQYFIRLSTGNVVAIAKAGGGPGELSGQGTDLHRIGSELVLQDVGGRRRIRRSMAGSHLETKTIQRRSVGAGPVQQFVYSGGIVEITTPGAQNFVNDLASRVIVFGANRVDTIATIKAGVVEFDVIRGINRAPSFASTGTGDLGAWSFTSDSTMVVADGISGEIRWYDLRPSGAALIRRTVLTRVTLPNVEAEAQAVVNRLSTGYRRSDPRARLELRRPLPPRSLATRIVPLTSGAIAVSRAPVKGSVVWSVVGADGTFRSQFSLPAGARVVDERDGILLALEVDADDLPVLRAYRY